MNVKLEIPAPGPTVNPAWQTWPRTYRACVETYFHPDKFGRAGEVPAHGNYMLAALNRYTGMWSDLHSHLHIQRDTLDKAAAHEIYYQHNRGRQFHRPVAALAACIQNLVTERPERILERHQRCQATRTPRSVHGRGADAAGTTAPGDSRVYPV